MRIESIAPIEPLREFVKRFRMTREPSATATYVHPVVARTDLALTFNLEGQCEVFEYLPGTRRLLPAAFIVGPQTGRRADLTGRWRSYTIEFEPAGFQRLFNVSAGPFVDCALDARDVLGRSIDTLREQLCHATTAQAAVKSAEEFLLPFARKAPPPPPITGAAVALRASGGCMAVSELAAQMDMSQRHFERRFVECLGMMPKLYGRITRMNHALGLKTRQPTLNWAAISQEAGYFDQNHLVKDFKVLAGDPPGVYLNRAAWADSSQIRTRPSQEHQWADVITS